MAITRQKKEEVFNNVKDKLKRSKMTVFVNFHGLNVSDACELRSSLKKADSNYFVAKKTLVKRAYDSLGIEGELPELEGEVALAYSFKDVIAPARGVKDYVKKKKMSILGGIFENKFIDAATATALADIPSREILLGQFVNVLNSPIQGFVGTLDAISKK